MVELIRSHNYVVTSTSFRENSRASHRCDTQKVLRDCDLDDIDTG